MILFHTTTDDNASAIMRDGFRGRSGCFMFEAYFEDVVFLGDRPANVQDGAHGDILIAVDVGHIDMSEYRIEEEGLDPWEYMIPASILNGLPTGSVAIVGRSLDSEPRVEQS